jgi:4-alpha-glucanotransferase
LNDYAIYRILKNQHDQRPWPEWDSVFVQRDPEALKQIRENFREDIETVRITQFLFDRQWRKLKQYANEHGIYLFGDMPIYIALDSADAWAHPEILLLGDAGKPTHVAGVPPDYFSEDGQLWGNPLYDWEYHESNGYQWWIERMQHAVNLADLVRIDHFRGFESFWAVRSGAETAREGEWLPGPGDGLFTAMKLALGRLPIVAEDLGVITPEVNGLRQRHNIPGMKVLQFLVGEPGFDIAEVSENRVCYTGTHDNDTTIGWFLGGLADTRSEQAIFETRENALKVTGGSGDTIHTDMIRLAFNSQARLAIAPMQDYLGLDSNARLNTPGTTSNNWDWRVKEEQLSLEFCLSVAQLVEESSRSVEESPHA